MNVSNIQHFSIGDGPGIRTTVFLKGCNLRCPWCHNPETQLTEPQTLSYSNGKTVSYGVEMSPQEVVREVMKDVVFYKQDGGATFSGGEPLLQADEVAETARLLKEQGIRIVIDTAACVPYASFEQTNPYADLYLFDVKSGNADAYRSIGGDLALVRKNLHRLMADGQNVRIRIPLIPGFNTSEEASAEILDILTEAGVTQADLLPFHRLGSSKYDALARPYAYAGTQPISCGELETIAGRFRDKIQVTFEN